MATKEELKQVISDSEEKIMGIVKRGFDEVDSRFKEVKDNLRDIKFRLADTVQRTEYHNLKGRVERLEEHTD